VKPAESPKPDLSGVVRYPQISVKLVGRNGNAIAVLGAVIRALRNARVPIDEIVLFNEEATSGDYDHLLATCMRWVDVC